MDGCLKVAEYTREEKEKVNEKNTENIYNSCVDEFLEELKTNIYIKDIKSKYYNKLIEKPEKTNMRRLQEGYYFVNKMERAVRKNKFSIKKISYYEAEVYISKTRVQNSDKKKVKVIEQKNIKQYVFDKNQLIEFFIMIHSNHRIAKEFLEISDVKFLIRQLRMYGISNILYYLKGTED